MKDIEEYEITNPEDEGFLPMALMFRVKSADREITIGSTMKNILSRLGLLNRSTVDITWPDNDISAIPRSEAA